MAQYIDKAAVVAEINKRIMEAPINHIGHQRVWAYNDVKNIIDTLEVKEVDLEKAIDDYIYTNNGRKRLALELDWKQCDITFKGNKLINFAKHFFELGMAASNKAQNK